MERPENPEETETAGRAPSDAGEDHREGPPGYDLDEQAAIEELEGEGEE